MSSTFTPSRMRISTDRYQMMIAAGVLTDPRRNRSDSGLK
jgi:hypothetical protein